MMNACAPNAGRPGELAVGEPRTASYFRPQSHEPIDDYLFQRDMRSAITHDFPSSISNENADAIFPHYATPHGRAARRRPALHWRPENFVASMARMLDAKPQQKKPHFDADTLPAARYREHIVRQLSNFFGRIHDDKMTEQMATGASASPSERIEAISLVQRASMMLDAAARLAGTRDDASLMIGLCELHAAAHAISEIRPSPRQSKHHRTQI